MRLTQNQKETLAIIKEMMLNSKRVQEVMNKSANEQIDNEVLETIICNEFIIAYEKIQKFLFELQIGFHQEKREELSNSLYKQLYKGE